MTIPLYADVSQRSFLTEGRINHTDERQIQALISSYRTAADVCTNYAHRKTGRLQEIHELGVDQLLDN